MPPKSRRASNATGAPTTTRCAASSRACAPRTVARCCGKAIRSAARCRSCSKAGCRTSTSAPRAARAVRRRCRRSSKRCFPRNAITTGSRTAASRAATSPATTARPQAGSTRCSWRSASATTWTKAASPGTRRSRRGCRPYCGGCWKPRCPDRCPAAKAPRAGKGRGAPPRPCAGHFACGPMYLSRNAEIRRYSSAWCSGLTKPWPSPFTT